MNRFIFQFRFLLWLVQYPHETCSNTHKGPCQFISQYPTTETAYSWGLCSWKLQGHLPWITPTLPVEPDPICSVCNFGKAHRKPHKSHTGHMKQDHTNPGDGISSDQLDPGIPGRAFTTKGSPTNLCYKSVNFWVSHSSSFVHITFHFSKEATELTSDILHYRCPLAKWGHRTFHQQHNRAYQNNSTACNA